MRTLLMLLGGMGFLAQLILVLAEVHEVWAFLLSSYLYLPKSMILQTGGCDMGATSTRSYPISSAFLSASIVVMMPSCSLSGPMTRIGDTLISLLILSFGTAIGHLSPSGSCFRHGAGQRSALHLLL